MFHWLILSPLATPAVARMTVLVLQALAGARLPDRVRDRPPGHAAQESGHVAGQTQLPAWNGGVHGWFVQGTTEAETVISKDSPVRRKWVI